MAEAGVLGGIDEVAIRGIDDGSAVSPWHVLWTRSHCEQLVHDQLAAKGFRLLLPRAWCWTRIGGRRRLTHLPLFPGYVFLNHALDKTDYIDVCRTRGLVQLLGERWDRLAVVPAGEIEAIRRVVEARVPAMPHPYLREGQRVRITRGPLAGVLGVFVRPKPNKGLLVVSIEMLQRSVAVEVDCTAVAAG